MTDGLIVSIDGPGGSGKSTVGMRAAARLGYRFCDTGVLYRGLTWLAMERGADLDVSVEERARRRAAERGLAEDARAIAQIEEELRRRDGIDSTRETAPLRIPDGATIIKTEGNTLDETVAEVVEAVQRLERERLTQ